ncbi:MAG: TetR/AcrR family transcriptional regulator [Kofleriaceae bacterium]|nr:TetR/AcrR family transcriptional regulator [Kofleriaceae bacterium]
MGRPKEFDRNQLLAKATVIFQRHGFSATSTQQLVEALGINRKSMYAEFGSKQGLFEAVLKRYNEVTIAHNFGPLETPSAGLREIEEVIRFFALNARGKGAGVGCLLCNTAVERAANDDATRPFVDGYIDRMTNAFQNALENAQRGGEIRDGIDPIAQARFLTTSVLGIAVLVRAKSNPDIVDGAAEVALGHLGSLR